jgi:hypothetical protein
MIMQRTPQLCPMELLAEMFPNQRVSVQCVMLSDSATKFLHTRHPTLIRCWLAFRRKPASF